jgi:hypothetical protein
MKRLLTLIVFLLSAQILSAQVELGLKGGYTAARLSADPDTVKTSFGSGFHVGGFARIGKKFFLQPEFCYTLQTDKLTGEVTGWGQKVTIGSLDIPVLAGYRFLNAKAVKLRVMAGPVASFVVNRNVKELEDVPGPLKGADINNVNWGIQAGAGADILFLTFDIRYQFGLNNLIKEVGTSSWNSKNSQWIISVGFRI